MILAIRLPKTKLAILERMESGWRPLQHQLPDWRYYERRSLMRVDWGPADTPDADKLCCYLTPKAIAFLAQRREAEGPASSKSTEAKERGEAHPMTTSADGLVELVARAMAEHAGFAWEACAQNQWRGDAAAGLAALSTAGWRVVPIAMPREAFKAAADKASDVDLPVCRGAVEAAWEVLLAAAPSPSSLPPASGRR